MRRYLPIVILAFVGVCMINLALANSVQVGNDIFIGDEIQKIGGDKTRKKIQNF